MGLRIFIGKQRGYEDVLDEQAILFDSVTDIAFGRIFSASRLESASEVADNFLTWCEAKGIENGDVRTLPTAETIALQDEFMAARREAGVE